MGSIEDHTDDSCMLRMLQRQASNGAVQTIALAICIPIAAFTIIGNGTILVAFAKRRCLHTPANMLLAALCLSDFMVGILIHPLFFAVLLTEQWSEPFVVYHAFFYTFSLLDGFSVVCLIAIALERYIAICQPFFYQRNVTCRRNIYGVILLITAWFILSMTFFIDKNTFLYFSVVMEDLIFVALLICYALIYREISLQKRSVIVLGTIQGHLHHLDVRNRQLTGQARLSSTDDQSISASTIRYRHRSNKTRTIAFILLFFYISFLPSNIYLIAFLANGKCFEIFDTEYGHLWLVVLALVNNAVNPILYYFNRSDIREAARSILRPRRGNMQIAPTSNTN